MAILISAGHYAQRPGAVNAEGISEFPETLVWANLLASNCTSFGAVAAIVPSGTLPEKVEFINEYPSPVSMAVEVHFNSSSSGGRGSETLYCPRSVKGKRLADITQNVLGALLPPNRGSKEGWYHMDRPDIIDFAGDVNGDEKPDYFLVRTRCPSIILEPEFIQNYDKIGTSRDIVCEALAHVWSTIDLEKRG